MRLSNVRVESFRGFGRELQLDCSADALILVGANGTGKTSFFDAVVWALYGDIPRLRGSRDAVGDDYVVNRFDAKSGPRVTLSFQNAEGVWSLTRTRQGPVVVDPDGVESGGAEASRWVGELMNATDDRTDSFAIFDRAHLLGQEEIAKFVRDTSPRERFDALSDLLGVGSVRVFYQTLERTLDAARERESDSTRQLLQLDRALEATRVELLALDTSASKNETIGKSRARRQLNDLGRRARVLGIVDPPDESGVEGDLLAAADDLATRLRAREERVAGAIRETQSLIQRQELEVSRSERMSMFSAERESATADLHVLEQSASALDVEIASLTDRLDNVRRSLSREQSALKARQSFLRDAIQFVKLASRVSSSALETQLMETSRELEEQLAQARERRDQDAAGLRERKRRLASLGRQIAEVERETQEHEELTRDIVSEWDPGGNLGLDGVSSALESLRASLRGIREDADELALQIRLLATRTKSAELRVRLESTENRRGPVAERARRDTESVNLLQGLVRDAKDAEVATVRNVLEGTNPLLNALYRRLRPHPVLGEIAVDFGKFKDRGEAYYEAAGADVRANIATMFSSAQLNAVAICIFLAISLSRREDRLATILLDDPIQNMDDYNVLGLVDLLRNVIQYRQVIVSTHDERIGELLRRKLRPDGPDTRTVTHRFVAFDTDGPRVVTYADTFVDAPNILEDAV
jgi:DNA repair exonuclease SbcCD ATPase subunit